MTHVYGGSLDYPPEISAILRNESIPGYLNQIFEFLYTKLNREARIVDATERKFGSASIEVENGSKRMDEIFDMKNMVSETFH